MSSNNVQSMEYLSILPKDGDQIFNLPYIISLLGARHVISDFYSNRQDILCNPFFKTLALFCIIYINVKCTRWALFIMIIYIVFVNNYIMNECNKEYNQNVNNVV